MCLSEDDGAPKPTTFPGILQKILRGLRRGGSRGWPATPERAWVFGIARRVHAAHCAARTMAQDKLHRLAGLAAAERALIELVDLGGLRAAEAAGVLGLAPGAARMRLMRARARLRQALAQEQVERPKPDHA